jgi:glycosyltransferase involved in cell wall biosynthesis
VGAKGEAAFFTGRTKSHRAAAVSVIIPVHNCASTLGAQLEALQHQISDVPWEIIVVDNGSTDGTQVLIKRYRKAMADLTVVNATEMKNGGFARNRGAAVAKGRVFLFCDGDDVIAPGWVAAMTRALERHDFVVGRIEVATLNAGVPEKYGNNGTKDDLLNFLPYAIGCNMGITRRAFESVGGFSTAYPRCMDIEFSWRVQLAGYSLHEVPEAEVYYRYRESAWSHWVTAFNFSKTHVALYKRFAAYGAKRTPMERVLTRYRRVIFGLARLVKMTQRQRIGWAFNIGVSLGRIWGSLRYMTLYL